MSPIDFGTIKNFQCGDLYIQNSLSSTTLDVDSPMSMTFLVGNAGNVHLTGSTVSTIIPAGFTGFTVADITCTPAGG